MVALELLERGLDQGNGEVDAFLGEPDRTHDAFAVIKFNEREMGEIGKDDEIIGLWHSVRTTKVPNARRYREFEHDLMVERTQEGLTTARARGRKVEGSQK